MSETTNEQEEANLDNLDVEESGDTALAEVESNLMVMGGDGPSVEGEFEQSDFEVPYLTVIQGTSKMFGEEVIGGRTAVGDMLAGGAIVAKVDETMEIVVIGLKKKFREVLSEEDRLAEERPRIFSTLDDVREAGLDPEWQEVKGGANVPPEVDRVCTVRALVKMPEKCADDVAMSFFYESSDGSKFMMADISANNYKAYNMFGKPIITGAGRVGGDPFKLAAMKFKISAPIESMEIEKDGKKSKVNIPRLSAQLIGKWPAEVFALAEQFINK